MALQPCLIDGSTGWGQLGVLLLWLRCYGGDCRWCCRACEGSLATPTSYSLQQRAYRNCNEHNNTS